MSGLRTGRRRTYLGSVGGTCLGPRISALALLPGPHSLGQGRVGAAQAVKKSVGKNNRSVI